MQKSTFFVLYCYLIYSKLCLGENVFNENSLLAIITEPYYYKENSICQHGLEMRKDVIKSK